MTLWQIIVTLAIGALIGWAASKVMKCNNGGLLRYIIIGVVGSFVGGWVGGLLGIGKPSLQNIDLVGMLVSIGGACLLIAAARFFTGKK